MTQYWFQSKLRSKYPSIITLLAYVVGSAYKIYLLIAQKSIRWFAVTHVIEAFVIAALLFVVYIRLGGKKPRWSYELGKKMLSTSKYYIGSAMMVVVFQQTDRIMINVMMTDAETGYYSAALSCVGMTGFVFSAIIDSARPAILEAKKTSEAEFEKRLVALYSIVTIVSLAQSVGMTLFSNLLITVLYGKNFLPAVPMLQIAVWYVAFSYFGSVRDIWILAEGKSKQLWYINLIGACANVVLNFLLIPLWGGCGAAMASLFVQFFANVVLGYVVKPIRYNNSLIIKGVNPRNCVSVIGKLLELGRAKRKKEE